MGSREDLEDLEDTAKLNTATITFPHSPFTGMPSLGVSRQPLWPSTPSSRNSAPGIRSHPWEFPDSQFGRQLPGSGIQLQEFAVFHGSFQTASSAVNSQVQEFRNLQPAHPPDPLPNSLPRPQPHNHDPIPRPHPDCTDQHRRTQTDVHRSGATLSSMTPTNNFRRLW